MDPVVYRRRRVRVSLRAPIERHLMKVLVCGGREYTDYRELCLKLDVIHTEREFTLLVHGDAKGADKLAGRWAVERGIQQVKVPANWEGLDTKAGMVRNQLMLDLVSPEVCVGFPGGIGTNKMMFMAHKQGVEVVDTDDINILT